MRALRSSRSTLAILASGILGFCSAESPDVVCMPDNDIYIEDLGDSRMFKAIRDRLGGRSLPYRMGGADVYDFAA